MKFNYYSHEVESVNINVNGFGTVNCRLKSVSENGLATFIYTLPNGLETLGSTEAQSSYSTRHIIGDIAVALLGMTGNEVGIDWQ